MCKLRDVCDVYHVCQSLHIPSDMLVFCLCGRHTLHCVMLIHQVPVFGQLMTGMVTLVQASATVLQANCTVSQLEATVVGYGVVS